MTSLQNDSVDICKNVGRSWLRLITNALSPFFLDSHMFCLTFWRPQHTIVFLVHTGWVTGTGVASISLPGLYWGIKEALGHLGRGGMPTIWYRHCHQGTSVLSRTGTGTPVGSQLTSTPYLLNPFNVFPSLKAVHSHHGCASCRALPTAWYSG